MLPVPVGGMVACTPVMQNTFFKMCDKMNDENKFFATAWQDYIYWLC